MALPVVAIIGRPNVGKSTLFNRLVGSRLAVVDDHPGITRDRLVRTAEWNGRAFHVVDTGGWVPEARDRMDGAILAQVLTAVEECDLVLFVVDARAGLHPHDRLIAQQLFRREIKALLVANKADHEKVDADVLEFAALGFQETYGISAAEGRGLGDLLDEVTSRFPTAPPAGVVNPDSIRVAIVGRPNVGKSSLVNRLLGEERMIVHDEPGTTRDAVDSPMKYHGREVILVDTAGIRRKLGNHPNYEFYATLRAMRAIDEADVAVLVLDAATELNRQDLRIASFIEHAGTGAVIAVNKWDLPEKDDASMGLWRDRIEDEIPFLAHAPTVFISAKTAQRIHKLPEAIVHSYDTAHRQISTSELNAVLERAMDYNPPKSRGSGQRPVRIYYATQVKTGPPTLALFVSEPERMAPDYLRFLIGRFREAFDLSGAPIRLVLKKS